MCLHYSNQLLYIVAPALDAVDVAELQVECTHKILLTIPALSNGVLSHLAIRWMSTCTGLCGLSTGRNSLTCFSSPPNCLEGQSFEFTANRSVPRPSMSAAVSLVIGASLSEPHIDEFAVEFVYIYYYYLCLVRRAVSHLQLLFCVHHLIIFVASHVHATLLAIACTKCSMNVRLHFLLRSVYFVIMYLGFYKHFKLFAEQRRETST